MKRIILPLDNKTCEESLKIMELTKDLVWGYKLRRQILEEGLPFVLHAKEYGKVMLDFKLFDIPSAMRESIDLHSYYQADITTVHCTAMYKPEKNMKNEIIAGVTILTSMDDNDFTRSYNFQKSLISVKVFDFTDFAVENNYGYIVCSPKDLNKIRHFNILKICPGIRPLWYQENDDQKRTMTPYQAVENGADLLVIGRPLLNHPDIIEAIEMTNEEIANYENLNF